MIEVERKKRRDVNVGEWREREMWKESERIGESKKKKEKKRHGERGKNKEKEKQIYEPVREKESGMRINELEKKETLRERKKGEIERTKI